MVVSESAVAVEELSFQVAYPIQHPPTPDALIVLVATGVVLEVLEKVPMSTNDIPENTSNAHAHAVPDGIEAMVKVVAVLIADVTAAHSKIDRLPSTATVLKPVPLNTQVLPAESAIVGVPGAVVTKEPTAIITWSPTLAVMTPVITLLVAPTPLL